MTRKSCPSSSAHMPSRLRFTWGYRLSSMRQGRSMPMTSTPLPRRSSMDEERTLAEAEDAARALLG